MFTSITSTQSFRDLMLTCQSSMLASMATAAQPGDARLVLTLRSAGAGSLRLHQKLSQTNPRSIILQSRGG